VYCWNGEKECNLADLVYHQQDLDTAKALIANAVPELKIRL